MQAPGSAGPGSAGASPRASSVISPTTSVSDRQLTTENRQRRCEASPLWIEHVFDRMTARTALAPGWTPG